MSEQESNRIRRIIGWGIIGLVVVTGLPIALSFYYFASLRPGSFDDYPFFFPRFHFGWLGAIFLIFIVFLIARWFLFRPWRGRGEGGYYSYQQRPDPASIVKERYAKGEITREQFEQMMCDLRQKEEG